MILVTGILAQAMEAFGQRLSQQGLWLKLAAGATWLMLRFPLVCKSIVPNLPGALRRSLT